MSSLLNVSELPSKYGSLYGELWGGLICGGLSVVSSIALFCGVSGVFVWIIAGVLSLLSAVLWFLFYSRFAIACKSTGDVRLYSLCYIIAWAMLLSFIIPVVPLIVAMVAWIKFGIRAKRLYTGKLSELGSNMITSCFFMLFGAIAAVIIGAILAVTFSIILGIAIVAVYAVMLIVYNYTFVWDEMVSLVEAGYFKQ